MPQRSLPVQLVYLSDRSSDLCFLSLHISDVHHHSITPRHSAAVCRRHPTSHISFSPSELSGQPNTQTALNERIEYKLLSISLTYKVLITTQPSYLHNLISLQTPRSTRSSSVVLSPINQLFIENHRSLIMDARSA